jgi:transposase-like protein
MKQTVRRIRKHRKFSDDFKKRIVQDFESGRYSVGDLSKLHSIAPTQIYDWIYKFSTVNKKGYRVVEMKESSDLKVKQLEQRIKELERIIGQKQIKIDYLEKMIELAEKELNIDIKKNSSTQPFGGSKNTKSK